jgi:hypothetical protein
VLARKTTYNYKFKNATPVIQVVDTDPESHVVFEGVKINEWIEENCRGLVLLRSNMYAKYGYCWIRFTNPVDVILFKTSFTDYEEMVDRNHKYLLATG